MTFFPSGSEDVNVPVAWGRSAQRRAGNPYSDQLFTVLLSSKGNLRGSFSAGVPTLQVGTRTRPAASERAWCCAAAQGRRR